MYTLPQNKQGNMTAGPILPHRSRIKKTFFFRNDYKLVLYNESKQE